MLVSLRHPANLRESSPCKWNIKELFDRSRGLSIATGVFPFIQGGPKLYDFLTVRGQKILVIFNPVAGGRGRSLFESVLGELQALGWNTTLIETKYAGHAEQIASALKKEIFNQHTVLVVAGGDGTLNEVINGLAKVGRLDTPIGLIPVGTINLLARELKLPRDPRLLAQVISNGNCRRITLGQITARRQTRLFLITAGVGFDARAVLRVSRHLRLFSGKLAFIVAGIWEYVFGKRVQYQVTVDGEALVARSILFANGKYYAGGMSWAPAADIERPTLEVGIFAGAGRLRIPTYVVAFMTGSLRQLHDVIVRSSTEIDLTGPSNEPVQADGDIVAFLPVNISIAPKRATVLA